MIKVEPKAEYETFDSEVRQPGAAFLQLNPTPNHRDFRKHSYWSRSKEHLWEAYDRICAYTSFHLPTGGSLDHFVPKSQMPSLAYEWSNFRICDARVNNWKKNSLVLVDPFFMSSDWVFLSFPECIIRVSSDLDPIVRPRVKQSIELLRLNKDETFVDFRYTLVKDFIDGLTDIEFLEKYYPFVGREVKRQGGREALSNLFT